jgi:uncharacterized protein YwqG
MDGEPQIDREKWRRKFTDAGIHEPVAAQLADLVRPSVRLTAEATAGEDSLPVGSSKLGGRPDLPPGLAWPTRPPFPAEVSRGDRPLAFVAQIALVDIAAVGGTDLELPTSGLLSFFYDGEELVYGSSPEDRERFRLMWFDDGALQRREPPQTLRDRFNAVRLSAQARDCIPSRDSFAVYELFHGLADAGFNRDKFDDFISEDERGEYSNRGHALGGWPAVIQSQMETECQFVTNGIFTGGPEGFRSERAAQLRPGAADWRLILQVDSDSRAGWMWGDVGRLYVWMREQDVRARRFDRCWTIMQCC